MAGDTANTGPNQSPEVGKFGMRPEVANSMTRRFMLLMQAAEAAKGPEALALQEELRAEQQSDVLKFAPKTFPIDSEDMNERRAA